MLTWAPKQVPPPEAQLWRFMDLAKLVTMLDRQALYFPVLAALDDKLEGALPRVPPDAMWALYGNHGVAVRTTFGLLAQAVHQRPSVSPPDLDPTVVGGMVNYADPDETSPPGNVWHPVRV